MLSRLEIENFRAFDRLTLDGLTRVNLLVGKNGCGKTTVLEAVHLWAGNGTPRAIWQVFSQRAGEWSKADREENFREKWTVRHLFHDVDPEVEPLLRLTGAAAEGNSKVEVDLPSLADTDLKLGTIDGRAVLWRPRAKSYPFSAQRKTLRITGDAIHPVCILELDPDGRLASTELLDDEMDNRRQTTSSLVPCSGIADSVLGDWFGKLMATDAEERVVAVIQLLRPDLERIMWIAPTHSTEGGFFLKMRGNKARVPLDLFGEGLRRLLGMAITMVSEEAGILLIDEIDTGLHYSLIEQLWGALIELSRQLDVQIFATTHSSDCIRALAWLVEDRPDLAPDVSLHRIEPGLPTSVRYGAEDIALAAKHHVEVRG